MADTASTTSGRKALLDKSLTDFTLFILKTCPEARLEVSLARYEDEDAHIWVFPPPSLSEEARETLADRLAEESIEILLKTGLLILTAVLEPQETQ